MSLTEPQTKPARAPGTSAAPGAPARGPWGAIQWVLRRPAVMFDAAAVAFSCALVLHANFAFMFPRVAMLSNTDATALAESRRLLEGDLLPYVDAVGTSGPVYSWIVAGVVAIFGYGTWMPARVLVLVSMEATLLLGVSAAFVARRRMVGALGALLYAGLTVVFMWRDPALALGVEQVGNAFVMGALFAMTRASRAPVVGRMPRGWAWVAGALVSLAAMCKLVDLGALLPLLVWAHVLDRTQPGRASRVAAVLFGLFCPALVVVLRYVVVGELGALMAGVTYACVRFAPTVHTAAAPDYFRDIILGHLELLAL